MGEHQQHNFVQIEISLINSKPKMKVKKEIFALFYDLDINDETDLHSISYAVNKEDNLVYKLIICFKSKNSINI